MKIENDKLILLRKQLDEINNQIEEEQRRELPKILDKFGIKKGTKVEDTYGKQGIVTRVYIKQYGYIGLDINAIKKDGTASLNSAGIRTPIDRLKVIN